MKTIEEAEAYVLSKLDSPEEWGSLIVNKRKPHTFRAFHQWGDDRICLHRFEPCEMSDAFWHPHPWGCEIKILSGEYRMQMGFTENKNINVPIMTSDMILTAGSKYSMFEPLAWHRVIPLTTCYSIMINSVPWEDVHSRAPTTKGKDLDKFTDVERLEHLEHFKSLLVN